MNKTEPRFVPFPNGTSFMMWMERNCERCWKSKVSDATGKSRCAIENAISIWIVGYGTVNPRIAKRLNWDGKSYLETDCAEREEKRPKQKKRIQGPELF
jgi:hypothetical protein